MRRRRSPSRWRQAPPPLRLPALQRIVRLPGRRCAEIVVQTWEGASTEAVGLYALLGRALVRVRMAQDPIATLSSGSLAGTGAVDCGDGGVVASAAIAHGRIWSVQRTLYRLAGTRLVVAARRTRELAKLPALFARGPFASCTVSRSAR